MSEDIYIYSHSHSLIILIILHIVIQCADFSALDAGTILTSLPLKTRSRMRKRFRLSDFDISEKKHNLIPVLEYCANGQKWNECQISCLGNENAILCHILGLILKYVRFQTMNSYI